MDYNKNCPFFDEELVKYNKGYFETGCVINYHTRHKDCDYSCSVYIKLFDFCEQVNSGKLSKRSRTHE